MFITDIDQLVNLQIHFLQSSRMTPLMIFITDLVSPVTVPIFGLLLAGYFWHRKQISKVYFVVFGLSGGFFLEVLLKMIVARPRPQLALLTETDYSFPSGHATIATILFLSLIILFASKIKDSLRTLFIAANVLGILLVSFSRLYLGVHWLSDVLAGILLGAGWVCLLYSKLEIILKRGRLNFEKDWFK
jgi:undecaprenyl-diphosphatase